MPARTADASTAARLLPTIVYLAATKWKELMGQVGWPERLSNTRAL